MTDNRFLSFILLLCGLFFLSFETAFAAQQPLLIEGKKALFQRVLTKPGARMVSSPVDTEAKPIPPFSIFYVYARESLEGKKWVEVGSDRHGTIAGWLSQEEIIDWNHGLTVAFRDPAGHDRVLLFRDAEQLAKFAETTPNDPAPYNFLYESASHGELAANSPVVAIQPKGYVDIRDDFYLVPIREYKEIFVGTEKGRMLRVSSVPHNSAESQAQDKGQSPIQPVAQAPEVAKAAGPALDTGVVFVVDATISMDPYINRTRAAIQKIYDDIANNASGAEVSFGLVAFRDDTKAVPGLKYRSKVFADLKKGRTASDFFAHVAEVKAATVSSKDFYEDAYAGVKQAIDDISWGGYKAKYMILITDAGAREANDPLSGTRMSAETLRQLARDNGIAIFVLHLLTKQGEEDHDRAREQYKTLSYISDIGDLYYGVDTGEVGDFGRVLDALGGQLVSQMRGAPLTAPKQSGDDQQLASLQEKVSKLGYALRMQYLDRPVRGDIPSLFDAWLLDRDFKEPKRQTLDVRVLLTRDQLSDLYQMLREVVETAEEGMLSPNNFLNDIKTLAATASRDPERLAGSTSAGGGKNLADLGFITEYIEDLPYTGDIMNVTLTDWRNWPAKRQLTFIQRLEERVQYYKSVHDHTDYWVSLKGGPVDGDSVFPIPLDMLP